MDIGLTENFAKKGNTDIAMMGVGNAEFQCTLDHEHMLTAAIGALETKKN